MKYFLILSFVGCVQSPNDKKEVQDDVVIQTKNIMEINAVDIPTSLKYVGDIVKAVKWNDKNGEQYLIISKLEQGEYFTPTWKSELYAYQYTNGKLSWDIKDFASNFYSKVMYVESSLEIRDIDDNGAYESFFLYKIDPDGLDPMIMKLMLHTDNAKKLPIRGILPKHKDDSAMYEKNIDKVFDDYNPDFKKNASDYWDSFFEYYKIKNW